MTTPDEAFLHEYESRKSLYRDFAERLAELLRNILAEHKITFQSVTHREKDNASLAAKLRRPDRSYTHLSDVTDLSGVRVITYFYDDVDRIATLMEGEFSIDRANSIDKRELMDPDRFGYVSLHYVLELSPERSRMSEYRRFAGLKAELQIRSLLQHVWAETEHDLGYKSAAGVPKLIRRRFARLAGMLEIADAEFVALRDELTQYELEVPERVQQEPASVQLDKASLRAYFQGSETMKRLDDAIAAVMDRGIVPATDQQLESDLVNLSFMGISTIGALDDALRANDEQIRQFARAPSRFL